jgi:hypothetical protein
LSWLRIDDGFAEHYKISELSDREFRVWVRVLCYAARNNGREGRLTKAMRREIVGLTETVVERLVSLALLERDEDDIVTIHDWPIYADISVREKVVYYLTKRNPDASANEVVRALGQKRELVLAEVKWFRAGSDGGSVGTTMNGSHGTGFGGSESGSRARAPVPSLNTGEESVSEKASLALPYLDHNAREAGQATEQTDDFGGTA